MEEIEKVEIIENKVEYQQPKFWHTVMAKFVDIFIFLLMGFILFSITNSIIVNSDSHKEITNRCDEIRLNSNLYYIDVNDKMLFINEYVDHHVNYPTYTSKVENIIKPVIETRFPEFLNNECGAEAKEKYLNTYDDFRKNIKNSDGVNYFIVSEGNIVENTAIYASENMKDYYNDVYKVFLEDYAQGYLVNYHEEYKELTEKLSVIFIFVEIPLCVVVTFILVYFVPALFFKRGRMTLGNALYRISLMDERLLSPTMPRFLARTGIIFLEIIASIFTFGIPLILSATLIAFSKRHQGFADYMLKIIKIDSSKKKVYMSYDEAKLAEIPNYKNPIDFKMKKPL